MHHWIYGMVESLRDTGHKEWNLVERAGAGVILCSDSGSCPWSLPPELLSAFWKLLEEQLGSSSAFCLDVLLYYSLETEQKTAMDQNH